MKRIFFYANIQSHDMSVGITKKVYNQVKALRNMGYEVFYTGYTENGLAIFNNNDDIVYSRNFKYRNKKISRFLRRWDLLAFSLEYLKNEKKKFDYGYLRYHHFDRAYIKLLKELKKGQAKVIVEAHGFPLRDFKMSAYSFIHLLDMVYESKAKKHIDLVAAISNEKNIWGCKTIQIDNAIDLNQIAIQPPKLKEDIIRLISVSNEMPYHGYPKLIKGLNEYYKNGGQEKIELHFIGKFRSETKDLIEKYNLNDAVFFHGKKFGEELDALYNLADLGIGALSSRAGVDHGSSIKTKEYFAKGIPFINGWKEYAFDDSYPYVKRFSLNLEYINFDKVIEFYNQIKNDKLLKENMRKFAEEHYTWEGQFEKVFNSIENTNKGQIK